MNYTKPSFSVSMNTPMTDEEREKAEELRRERDAQEAARLEELRRAAEDLPARPANNPRPTCLDPWGRNFFIGRVIPNEEARTASGLVLVNTKVSLDRPHACKVVQVAPEVEDRYPKLKEARDALARGEDPDLTVLYQCGAGHEWDDLDGETYVHLDARYVLGDYNPEAVRRGA